jgi:response regulator RpfG family c-di-GMP phosphodiesterase
LEAIALDVQGEWLLQIKGLGDDFNRQRRQRQSARQNLLIQEQLELEVLSRTRQFMLWEAEMLDDSGISMLDCAAEIAGCHHEKWSGEDYPRGRAHRRYH